MLPSTCPNQLSGHLCSLLASLITFPALVAFVTPAGDDTFPSWAGESPKMKPACSHFPGAESYIGPSTQQVLSKNSPNLGERVHLSVSAVSKV
jgi:hypothetical protein